MSQVTYKYVVEMPSTPGAEASVQAGFDTVSQAMRYARKRGSRRPDLRYQDIVVRDQNGVRVRFAGPLR